jgi:hypothetical protein
MSGIALFAYGTLVTLIVAFGIGLLVWGAILDGRYEREVRARLREATEDGLETEPSSNGSLRRAPARER